MRLPPSLNRMYWMAETSTHHFSSLCEDEETQSVRMKNDFFSARETKRKWGPLMILSNEWKSYQKQINDDKQLFGFPSVGVFGFAMRFSLNIFLPLLSPIWDDTVSAARAIILKRFGQMMNIARNIYKMWLDIYCRIVWCESTLLEYHHQTHITVSDGGWMVNSISRTNTTAHSCTAEHRTNCLFIY